MKNYLLLLFVSFNTLVLVSQIRFRERTISHNKVKSLYQEDSTDILTIRTGFSKADSLMIFFILPVEEQKEIYKYGSGIQEIKKLIDSNLINSNIVFIQPGFARIPWYGNHPDNPRIWQEKYLIDLIKQVSLDFSDYSLTIYLLGFSKSGWGSLSILLNYPNIIDGIFIWDAPLSTEFNANWGMDQVFKDNFFFDKKYQLSKRIKIAEEKLRNKLIVIGGYDVFRNETEPFLKAMDDCKINYYNNPDLIFKHEWNKEWIYSLFQYKHGIISPKNTYLLSH